MGGPWNWDKLAAENWCPVINVHNGRLYTYRNNINSLCLLGDACQFARQACRSQTASWCSSGPGKVPWPTAWEPWVTEWVRLYHVNVITRNHQRSNNYAEASIRIMKDTLLNRTKAFNVVALVEYCNVIWEQWSWFWRQRRSFCHVRAKSAVLTQELTGRNDVEKSATTVNSVMLDCVWRPVLNFIIRRRNTRLCIA